ncbi:MAG: hypothetical protein NC092_00235 [Butyrivibrio sp.]|nr:hypothetical protein [Muribaculum sp.]MCM1551101.1 hypothetical protein [Butyrivibrio sp.]
MDSLYEGMIEFAESNTAKRMMERAEQAKADDNILCCNFKILGIVRISMGRIKFIPASNEPSAMLA